MVLGFFVSKTLCNFFGYVYPTYASYKAVESNDVDEHTFWLSYWIINAGFMIFEMFGDILISWLPLYYEAKIVFLAWLTLPQFKGVMKMYSSLVAPYLKHYESDIDNTIEDVRRHASVRLGEARDHGMRYLKETSADLLVKGQQMLLSGAIEAQVQAITGGGGTTSTMETQRLESVGVVMERQGASVREEMIYSNSTSTIRFEEEAPGGSFSPAPAGENRDEGLRQRKYYDAAQDDELSPEELDDMVEDEKYDSHRRYR